MSDMITCNKVSYMFNKHITIVLMVCAYADKRHLKIGLRTYISSYVYKGVTSLKEFLRV